MLRCSIINKSNENFLNFQTVDAVLSGHYAALLDRHARFVANAKDGAAPLISYRSLRHMFDFIH